MRYITVERSSDSHQQPVAPEQISAMCERAFGRGKNPEEVRELGGGEYNNTYLITFVDGQRVILRVSPDPAGPYPGRGSGWMRNEQFFQSYLAPISTFMPKTLMVDFTHQLISRDYMFQTFMEGERWSDVEGELSLQECKLLWQQLGHIARDIHSVRGEWFGAPAMGTISQWWSTLVCNRLSSLSEQLEIVKLDAKDVRTVLEVAQANSGLLDEIRQPRLLHGDLWTFNVLIKRDQENPRISAVLDSDSCSWGDPMADWTMFLLHIRETEGTTSNDRESVQAFWQAYGPVDRSKGARFREQVYLVCNFAQGRLDRQRQGRNDVVQRTYDRVRECIVALQYVLNG